ncbi:hypothetical protein FOZ63_019315, partial [Perkinsus olseni]
MGYMSVSGKTLFRGLRRAIRGDRRPGFDNVFDVRVFGVFNSPIVSFIWNYVLLAYGVVAFLASFKAGGFFMNLLAIAQVLALAVPYHDSRNPAHDADLAYYSLWA